MVTKVNGYPQRGFWFSADVATLNITTTGGDFINDADGVNGADSVLEEICELVSAHGTIIALSLAGAADLNLMVDYAQAFATDGTTIGGQTASTIETDLETAINGLAGQSAAAVTIQDGFTAAATS
jgi:hypothetical protein